MKKLIYLKDDENKYYVVLNDENVFDISKENMIFNGNIFYTKLYKDKQKKEIEYEIENRCSIAVEGDHGKRSKLLLSRLNELFTSVHDQLILNIDDENPDSINEEDLILSKDDSPF